MTTTVRELARRIDREARARQLRPGAKLAAEPDLISFFETSRGTLREALRLLGFLGRIESRFGPGGGTVVAEPDPSVVTSSVAMVLQGRGASVGEALRALALLAPAAAAEAAKSPKDEHLDAMSAAVTELKQAADLAAFGAAFRAFEAALGAASGNQVVAILSEALVGLAVLVTVEFPPRSRRRYAQDLDELVEAIRVGDPDTARALCAASWARRVTELERRAPRVAARLVTWAEVDEDLQGRGPRNQR